MAADAGYVASQNKRFADAVNANDQTMINKLKADAAKVGYTLSYKAPTVTKPVIPSTPKTPEIAQQKTAIVNAAVKNGTGLTSTGAPVDIKNVSSTTPAKGAFDGQIRATDGNVWNAKLGSWVSPETAKQIAFNALQEQKAVSAIPKVTPPTTTAYTPASVFADTTPKVTAPTQVYKPTSDIISTPVAPPTPSQIATKLGLTDGTTNASDGTVWDSKTNSWVSPTQKQQMDAFRAVPATPAQTTTGTTFPLGIDTINKQPTATTFMNATNAQQETPATTSTVTPYNPAMNKEVAVSPIAKQEVPSTITQQKTPSMSEIASKLGLTDGAVDASTGLVWDSTTQNWMSKLQKDQTEQQRKSMLDTFVMANQPEKTTPIVESKPVITPVMAQPAEAGVTAPPSQSEIAKQLGITDGTKNPADGTVWDSASGNWVSPVQKIQMDETRAEEARKEAFNKLPLADRIAQAEPGTFVPPTGAGVTPKDGDINPTDGTVWSDKFKSWMTPGQKAQTDQFSSGILPDLTTIQPEQKQSLLPKLETPSDITTQPQETNLQKATSEIERQIAEQNKALDLQTKQATEARDLALQEQQNAFNQASREMRDQLFGQQQRLMQGMAGRGLLSSGIFQDAMLRLGMSMNQNIRDADVKRQSEISRVTTSFNDSIDKINLKREELQSGKTKNIKDLADQMSKADADAQKSLLDAQKLEKESRDTMFKVASDMLQTLASQGKVNIMPYIPYLISGNLDGLAGQMYNDKANPALSVAGQETLMKMAESQQNINKMQNDIIKGKADAADTWSKIKGVISDEYGNPVLINGKTQKTQSVTEFEKELKIKQQEANTAVKNAATSAAKKSTATKAEQKAMTLPQQMKFVDDSITPLLQQQMTPDEFNVLQKTGRVELTPGTKDRFNSIMKEWYDRGDLDEGLLRNFYRAYNLDVPYWLGGIPTIADIRSYPASK